MNAGAPIEGMSDRASLLLGLLILVLVCAPLVMPWLLGGGRPMLGPRRAARRRRGRSVATTTDPAVWLGCVDRAGPPVFDVEADPLLPWAGPAPRGLHLTDAEIEAVAISEPPPYMVPIGDQAEAWLRANTP